MASQVQSLAILKESIERQISDQSEILAANNCNMHSPLVDAEGFPRADIDIYAVRNARVRIIELRNDLSKVMNDLAIALRVVYDPQRQESTTTAPMTNGVVSDLLPFARVDGVAPGSPATQAGLQREDLIVKFGPLTHQDFASTALQPLAKVVADNENLPLQIQLLRSGNPITLTFTPRKWDGRGLLGCHIVPYSSPSS